MPSKTTVLYRCRSQCYTISWGFYKRSRSNNILTDHHHHHCRMMAGKFAMWMIPQLFAYALNFPIQKFLQAQRKVMVMACIAGVVLVQHAILSWLLILRLGWGLAGAAITLNISWWFIVVSQLLYIFITKSDGAWSGFSCLAFADLFSFVKLSLASAVMLWYKSLNDQLTPLFEYKQYAPRVAAE